MERVSLELSSTRTWPMYLLHIFKMLTSWHTWRAAKPMKVLIMFWLQKHQKTSTTVALRVYPTECQQLWARKMMATHTSPEWVTMSLSMNALLICMTFPDTCEFSSSCHPQTTSTQPYLVIFQCFPQPNRRIAVNTITMEIRCDIFCMQMVIGFHMSMIQVSV